MNYYSQISSPVLCQKKERRVQGRIKEVNNQAKRKILEEKKKGKKESRREMKPPLPSLRIKIKKRRRDQSKKKRRRRKGWKEADRTIICQGKMSVVTTVRSAKM